MTHSDRIESRVPRVHSVNVGAPTDAFYIGDRPVRSAIKKHPVGGRVRVTHLGITGDGQADLRVHGGPLKAVYAYPLEHYEFWRRELGGFDETPGAFGENLTIEGLLEDRTHSGDSLRIGSALLRVTQPRFPCYKLGLRFGSEKMIQQFLRAGRSGFYMSVTEEGEIAEGDPIEIQPTKTGAPTIRELFQQKSDPLRADG